MPHLVLLPQELEDALNDPDRMLRPDGVVLEDFTGGVPDGFLHCLVSREMFLQNVKEFLC